MSIPNKLNSLKKVRKVANSPEEPLIDSDQKITASNRNRLNPNEKIEDNKLKVESVSKSNGVKKEINKVYTKPQSPKKLTEKVPLKHEQKPLSSWIFLGFITLLLIFLFFWTTHTNQEINDISSVVINVFSKYLPRGNSFISSLDFAEQIINSLRIRPRNIALSLLTVGSNMRELNSSLFELGKILCGKNVAYLDGKNSEEKFSKELIEHAKIGKKK